ncbi:MAG: DUF3305 domain-containing protein [Thiolinea sp.]
MTESSLQDAPQLPDQLSVAVILEKRPSVSPWAEAWWTVVAVVVGESRYTETTLLQERDGISQYLVPGLPVRLYRDECEGYYHNLQSPQPGCYVIAANDEQGRPVPQRVTLSFDEANSYLQGSTEVYAVPIPAELYRWTEAYVLEHYVPVKRKKRRLTDWNEQDRGH